MRLTTKCRYGARFMVDLAMNNRDQPVPLSRIVKRQHISKKYLEQIVIQLKRGRLVKAIRGVKGGYQLARPPSRINMYDIFKCIESEIFFVKCLKYPESCPFVSNCSTRNVWQEISELLRNRLKAITLQDLISKRSP